MSISFRNCSEVLEGAVPLPPGTCDRVAVDRGCTATSEIKAFEEYNIKPVIAFVRPDGWTLGAPAQFAYVAYMAWHDRWESFWFLGEKRPITEFPHIAQE